MINKRILRLALPTPLKRLFDYVLPQHIDYTLLIKGMRVVVPFQSRTLVGILMEVATTSTVPEGKLKQAVAILDEKPLFPPDIMSLCQWAAEYYHYALGEVLASAMPLGLRKGKDISYEKQTLTVSDVQDSLPELNTAQQLAVEAIANNENIFCPFLLDGVTGSGKTEVYLRAIEKILNKGKQVLVLVPEISLTPQTIQRFRNRFPVSIVSFHSGMTEKTRLHAWFAAKLGEASIVIGTRSAVFMPFLSLGLIIIDEEHDTSFKQQDRFRYQARDLAVMRASINSIPIVLGSATPSLESLLNVSRNRYTCLSLPKRAGGAALPTFQVIDVRHASLQEGLSAPLLAAMREHLIDENQVILFLNRRGFAPVLYCLQCAALVSCKRCDARMVYHHMPPLLKCHHCDYQHVVPKQCAACGAAELQALGVGTQRLEQTLSQHFPHIPILRIDRDSTRRKGSMQTLLNQVHAEKRAILLGTQMLAKGHHFPHVTLVGMIDGDSGLFSADFRATEQMGQLLLQVGGRAGRAEKTGTVMIQTRYPHHDLLQVLLKEGYQPFADLLLSEREKADLPPFSYFAVFRAEAYVEKSASDFLDVIKQMSSSFSKIVTVCGPVAAILSKRKGLYCQQLLIKADKRSALQYFLKNILEKIEKKSLKLPVKWVVDVDPIEVL